MLNGISPPLDRPVLDALVAKYRSQGDGYICRKCLAPCESHAADVLLSHVFVETHMRLAISFANKTGYSGPDRDELVSDLFMSLIKSVQKAQTNLIDDNLTAYILKGFGFALIEFKANRPLIRLSRSSYYRSGRPAAMKHVPVEDTDWVVDSKTSLAELKDDLAAIACAEREWQVLDLILQGYTQTEIACTLRLQKRDVCRVVDMIRTRYRKLLDVGVSRTDGKRCDGRVQTCDAIPVS